jgi:hypothetical protein
MLLTEAWACEGPGDRLLIFFLAFPRQPKLFTPLHVQNSRRLLLSRVKTFLTTIRFTMAIVSFQVC